MKRFAFIFAVCVGIGTACGCAHAIPYSVEPRYGVDDPQFIYSMGNLFGQPMFIGNRVTTLVNGDQIFPAMLDAIRSAQHTITLETYTFRCDQTGQSFIDALGERARTGVKVHVILDCIGYEPTGNKGIEQLEAAGIAVHKYHDLHWWQIASSLKANYRTHRKLLVVDGKIGFIGGVGIADRWRGNAQDVSQWRDNHYLVRGPIVAQIQAAFVDNWVYSTGEVLHGAEYFPKIETQGPMIAQVLKSSVHGGNGSENVQLMYLMSLAAAKERICLATAYFVPDPRTTREIVKATHRGVKVRVIVPGRHTDAMVARQASRASWGPLLKAGVEIYEYEPTMCHVKLMVVDDQWVSIGSANFDNRSFRLNDEANMNVLDADFAAEQVRLFEQDLLRCKRISYEDWNRRSIWKKLLDGMSTVVDSQL